MAAVAIDLGAAFNERRQDQSAADAAALAAGVEFLFGQGESQAIAAAKIYVDENLGRTLTSADWLGCQDPNAYPPTGNEPAHSLDSADPCISFGTTGNSVAFNRIRVKVPTQSTNTTFARVLGVLTLETSAVAEVELEPVLDNGAFPASAFAGAGGGDTLCIKTSGGNSGSCGDPDSGTFGDFNPYFYKEVGPGNPDTQCTSGDQPAPLAYVMARGLDHNMGVALTEGSGDRVNGADCPDGPINPNLVNPGGGYSNNDVTNGMLKGGNYDNTDYDGRLEAIDWGHDYGTATVFGVEIDNRPLWTFLDNVAAAEADSIIDDTLFGFSSCSQAAAGPDYVSSTPTPTLDAALANLIACLEQYDAKGLNLENGLFTSDLYDSPRITIVPRFWEAAPKGANNCCYEIKDFLPVYIDSIWTSHSSSWTCNGAIFVQTGDHCRHDPGRAGTIDVSAAGQQRIDSVSAIVLTCEMLPGLEDPRERCKKIETPDGSEITIFLNLFLVK